MADEYSTKRIINLPAESAPAPGDVLVVDNERTGTKKLPVSALTADPSVIEQAVTDWLDDHPEATTTVQDGSITEAKLANALKLKTINNYVTPEMFGAVGDGVEDDTQAIQNALDGGENVCFTHGKQYRITSSLYIKDLTGRKGRTIFSDAFVPWRTLSSLICDFPNVVPVFVIQDDGITFQNVTIDATNAHDNSRTLTLFKTDLSAADVDITITECAIYGAFVIIDIVGRGLRMVNNCIATCSRIATIAWSYESDNPWHDDATGMRAYIIDNNRFHSMSQTTYPLIEVTSGNVYGFHMCGNVLDRGYSSLVHATSKINNWMISNNVFNGIKGYGSGNSFVTFDDTVEQFTFSNNTLTNVIGSELANIVILCNKDISNSIIANNNINIVYNGNFIQVNNADVNNTLFAGNVIGEIRDASTHRGLLLIFEGYKVAQSSFMGNIISKITSANSVTRYGTVIRCAGACTLEKVKMFGNVVQSNTEKDYLIGTPTIIDCIFDFTT